MKEGGRNGWSEVSGLGRGERGRIAGEQSSEKMGKDLEGENMMHRGNLEITSRKTNELIP